MSSSPQSLPLTQPLSGLLRLAGMVLLFSSSIEASAAPPHTVLETRTITPPEEPYAAWPTLGRRSNGELWTVWSGGRDAHVCPMGQVRAMNSRDGGKTWSYPRVVLDSALDDRDSGFLETARGTLIATTFTSLAYERYLEKASVAENTPAGWKNNPMPGDQRSRWQGVHRRLNDAERKAELGEWLIRSTDGGLSWSPRIRTLLNSPHGPTQLQDGRLLYAGKQLWTGDKKIGVAESKDDGGTWSWLADIPVRPGDDAQKEYHELHQVETDDGRIVVQIRKEGGKANGGETLQCESSDGGRTWTVPAPIGVWGLPSHLLKLRDHRLLMTYGYRRVPFGNQARISSDHGRTWSEPIALSEDGSSIDLGYPSTVELSDGSLLTVWYEKLKDSPKAVLRQVHWML